MVVTSMLRSATCASFGSPSSTCLSKHLSKPCSSHTQRLGSPVGHADDPREKILCEGHRWVAASELADLPFDATSMQVATGRQRVAEDEVVPGHPAPAGVFIPLALAVVVDLLWLPLPPPAAHDRRHLRPAPPVPARRRLVHLAGLHLVCLRHSQRDVREVVQLLEPNEPIHSRSSASTIAFTVL